MLLFSRSYRSVGGYFAYVCTKFCTIEYFNGSFTEKFTFESFFGLFIGRKSWFSALLKLIKLAFGIEQMASKRQSCKKKAVFVSVPVGYFCNKKLRCHQSFFHFLRNSSRNCSSVKLYELKTICAVSRLISFSSHSVRFCTRFSGRLYLFFLTEGVASPLFGAGLGVRSAFKTGSKTSERDVKPVIFGDFFRPSGPLVTFQSSSIARRKKPARFLMGVFERFKRA